MKWSFFCWLVVLLNVALVNSLYEVHFLFLFRPLFSYYNITNPTFSLWMTLHLQLYK